VCEELSSEADKFGSLMPLSGNTDLLVVIASRRSTITSIEGGWLSKAVKRPDQDLASAAFFQGNSTSGEIFFFIVTFCLSVSAFIVRFTTNHPPNHPSQLHPSQPPSTTTLHNCTPFACITPMKVTKVLKLIPHGSLALVLLFYFLAFLLSYMS
jgi:hypothetical protein